LTDDVNFNENTLNQQVLHNNQSKNWSVISQPVNLNLLDVRALQKLYY